MKSANTERRRFLAVPSSFGPESLLDPTLCVPQLGCHRASVSSEYVASIYEQRYQVQLSAVAALMAGMPVPARWMEIRGHPRFLNANFFSTSCTGCDLL